MSWILKITSINLADVPVGNQTIDISYREGGTAGAFTSAGTVICNPSGAIVSTPNPFAIGGIDDAWASVEIKIENQCNEAEILQTFNKPA